MSVCLESLWVRACLWHSVGSSSSKCRRCSRGTPCALMRFIASVSTPCQFVCLTCNTVEGRRARGLCMVKIKKWAGCYWVDGRVRTHTHMVKYVAGSPDAPRHHDGQGNRVKGEGQHVSLALTQGIVTTASQEGHR